MILKPFQQTGASFLAGRTRALLADEPGVGKTAQFITAANLIYAKRVAVVCPEIAREHWRRECGRWDLAAREVDIIGWGEAHEWVDPKWTGLRWDALIPDESHFGKNPHARRTKAVFGRGGLAWHARHIWAGSGTPAPNHVGELWPLMRAFGKTAMDQDTFTRHFCYVDDLGKVRGNRPDRMDELRATIKSFTLRRKKADVLPELGPIDIQEWFVKPDAAFVRATGWGGLGAALQQEADLRAALSGKSAEDLLTFLAGDQEFATLRRYNALLKAPAVFEAIKFELENNLLEKVVGFGIHKEALEALHNSFQRAGIPCALIYGDTLIDKRDSIIEDWKRSGVVLLASVLVASTAIDLTAAHQGIMLELDWTPSNNAQAMQRMHRHGQRNPVTIRVAMGSEVDEIVNRVLLRKTAALAEVFD